jgi:hypothetical protein
MIEESMRQRVILFLLLNLFLNSSVIHAQGELNAVAKPLQPVIRSDFMSSDAGSMPVPLAYVPENQNGQEDQYGCDYSPSCYSAEDSEESAFRLLRNGSRLQLTGWVESGLYTNAHGATSKYGPAGEGLLSISGNGQNFGAGLRTTHYNMNQLWGRLAREMDCENGLDWGFQADLIYGMNGYGVQSVDSFDIGW